MKFNVVNRCQEDLSSMHGLLKSFLPFARKTMGFDKPPTIYFQSDEANASKLLGKTAHYDPTTMHITVYVSGRHPKDVLRSLSHELVHHGQNCRGEFSKLPDTAPGYAQNDPHLRGMEEEAFKIGNLCFRDWEDGVKSGSIPVQVKLRESKSNIISLLSEVSISQGMGSRSNPDQQVMLIQHLLVQEDPNALPKYGIDGIYRSETQNAVSKFQEKYNLQNTGSIDQQTYDLLLKKGNVEKANQEISNISDKNKKFASDPTYTGGLEELRQRVSPNKLYKDLVNSGLNQNLSKALVANAKGESAFIIGVAGDQGTYARVRFKNRSIPFNGKGPSCSLGLWQFNICGGLGLEYMKSLGLTHNDDDEEIYNKITNYDNQIDFMSSYLLKQRSLPRQASSEDYIAWLVRNVIRPADMPGAIEKRLRHLRNLEGQGVFSTEPSRKISKGGILYLGDSQMQGNFGKALIAKHGDGVLIAEQGTTASNWVSNSRLISALRLKPSRIIISLGGNGVGDVEGLLRLIKSLAPDANVVWSGAPPPVKDRFYTKGDRYNTLFRSRKLNNSRIKGIVEDAGFKFIDPYDYFTSYASEGDGIHLPLDVASAYVDKTFNQMSSTLREWKNSEINRLLLEKFNFGDKK